MNAVVEDAEGLGEDEDLAAGLEKKKKLSGKQLILFIGLPVLLLAAGAGAYFFFLKDSGEHVEASADAPAAVPATLSFYDLPEMLVNLNTGGRKASYLKIKVALEVDKDSALAELDAKLPRVVNEFQVYLRELRPEDLNGSAGMYRLKEELMARVNTALYPTQIKDVLFKEMLVQ